MCCCFGVRHGQLLLGFLSLFCLFTNLNLIHLTSVLHPSTPDRVRAFESLKSLHPGRFKREISSSPSNLSSKWDEGHPIANDEDGKGPIPVEKVTEEPVVRTTVAPTTFIFSNPPTTPSTTQTTKSTPSMKWPETTTMETEEEEEEVTEMEPEDDEVTQIISKEDPKRDVKEQKKKGPIEHWTMDTMLRLAFFACAGLGMVLACSVLLFLPTTINPGLITFIALLVSALVTAWIPFINFYGAAVARLIQGVCVAFCLPLASSLVVEWAPLRHRAFFLTFLLLAYPASILGPWPLAQLFSDFELPYWTIYAVATGLSVITAGLVLWRYRQRACDHFYIKGEELSRIRAGKDKEELHVSRALPNHRSTSFWISTVAFYGFFLALVMPCFYLPSLLANPDLMWTWNLGVTAAIPFAAFTLVFYFISLLPYSPLTSRVLNTIGLVMTGICLFLLPLLIDPERNILLPIALIALGLIAGGVPHLSIHHASLRLLPSLGLSLSLAHLTAPLLVHLIVPDNGARLSWASSFSTAGLLVAISAVPFVVAAKPTLFPPKMMTSLKPIDVDEECGLQEMQELPPAGKHLN